MLEVFSKLFMNVSSLMQSSCDGDTWNELRGVFRDFQESWTACIPWEVVRNFLCDFLSGLHPSLK